LSNGSLTVAHDSIEGLEISPVYHEPHLGKWFFDFHVNAFDNRNGLMRPARGGALRRLPAIATGQRQRFGIDATAGRAVHGVAVSLLAANDGDAAGRGASGQPQAGAAADAANGHRRLGAEAAEDEAGAGPTRSSPICRATRRSVGRTMWAADITYVPIGRGFLYLVAVIAWASRAVLAWRLSNTMDVSFCVAALDEALARFGKPEFFDSGSRSPPSPARSRRPPSGSRWTGGAAGWTTCSSSGCGAA
jgi:hypothetical protein